MHLNRYCLRNFRRLEDVTIPLETQETVFVGANNAGKTSATAAFRLFVNRKSEFKIHDFPSALIKQFDDFGNLSTIDYETILPKMELDLWFTLSSAQKYGAVASFLPNVKASHTEVGVRLEFSVKDLGRLYEVYRELHHQVIDSDDSMHKPKSMSYYLSLEGNLKKHFSLKYYKLQQTDEVTIHPISLDEIEGRNTLDKLIRVDFVEAQRHMGDVHTSRSNGLSSVFTSFYDSNLEKHKASYESQRVIEKSNEELSSHYESQFDPLISTISALGFPSTNDRDLKVVSNLNPEKALSSGAILTYIEKETGHVLPEEYNGLGFKNLIFIAIQVASFQIQWANTEKSRPHCQIIFIEEPEAHLHAQIQQVFIRKIRDVIEETNKSSCFENSNPQMVITSHSSHIISEASFECIRYFQRCESKLSGENQNKLKASTVLDISKFNKDIDKGDNIEFLMKYLELTHCDLFFSDAVILIEGTVERLLLPKIIKDHYPTLKSSYITILELGGAYSHVFADLLSFLNVPTLIITDLDSVDPNNNNKTCRADLEGAVTSNSSIKNLLLGYKKKFSKSEATLEEQYLENRKVSRMVAMNNSKKEIKNGSIFVAFQTPVKVPLYGSSCTMIPRTFEESFIYENIKEIRENKIDALIELPEDLIFDDDYDHVFKSVSSNFKKVEFALRQIQSNERWIVPKYIRDGLDWINNKLDKKKELSEDA